LTKKTPYKGLGADSEEKHEPASDVDTVVVDSLKALDPKRPIREADIVQYSRHVSKVPQADIARISVHALAGRRLDSFQSFGLHVTSRVGRAARGNVVDFTSRNADIK
jgi:hypothetical protein